MPSRINQAIDGPAGEVAPVQLSRPRPVFGLVAAEVPIAAPEEEDGLGEHHGHDRCRGGAGERVGLVGFRILCRGPKTNDARRDCPVSRDMERATLPPE